ncbi:MAG: hypothetical protein RLZ05_1512, partial [Bacteroidota bacterium]
PQSEIYQAAKNKQITCGIPYLTDKIVAVCQPLLSNLPWAY